MVLYILYMAKLTKEDLEEMLRTKGFRVTEHRLAVLKTVALAKQPITVHTLFDLLRAKYNIDQATIYRNLSSLHEAGLLRRVDFNHGHAHYELETEDPLNLFVCSKCETMEKINGIPFDEAIKKSMKNALSNTLSMDTKMESRRIPTSCVTATSNLNYFSTRQLLWVLTLLRPDIMCRQLLLKMAWYIS